MELLNPDFYFQIFSSFCSGSGPRHHDSRSQAQRIIAVLMFFISRARDKRQSGDHSESCVTNPCQVAWGHTAKYTHFPEHTEKMLF